MIRSTFALPVFLALISMVGLILALTGDGWRDQLSCVLLATPLIAVAWSAARHSERNSR